MNKLMNPEMSCVDPDQTHGGVTDVDPDQHEQIVRSIQFSRF
jgi:hypothetical protein